MEYTIASAYSPDSLVNAVKKLLEQGWVPTGGIACGLRSGETSLTFYQAMMRNKR